MKSIPLYLAIFFAIAISALAQDYPAYRIRSDFADGDKVVTGHGLCVPMKIDGKRVVLTAAHIVKNEEGKDADEIIVDFPVGWIRCKVIKIDIEHDLCLLEPKLSPPETVELDKKNNQQTQVVVNPNFYADKKMTLQEGVILSEIPLGRWVAKIEKFNHGSSGSPVYTKEGKLCGLGIAGVTQDGGKTMPFAVVAGREELAKFLTRKAEE